MRNRIVFLDFDGVLNNRLSRFPFDKTNVGFFNYFLDLAENELGARPRIVVTSSQRIGVDLGVLADTLSSHAGVIGKVIGKTNDDRSGIRATEIAAWLRLNGPVDGFVIIDDNDDMYGLSNHLVLTKYDFGFRAYNINDAVQKIQLAPDPRSYGLD